MRPALTPEEWANFKHVERNDGGYPIELSLDPPHFLDITDGCTVTIRISESLPAVVALSGHRQPWWFTHEDVWRHRRAASRLRFVVMTLDMELQLGENFRAEEGRKRAAGEIAWHESMAERIAALLTPEVT